MTARPGLAAAIAGCKHDLRVEAYGTVDEANSCIGLARLHTENDFPELDAMLMRIQNDLFDLGADLCNSRHRRNACLTSRCGSSIPRSCGVEADIDQLNAHLAPLRSFVLPGGSPASAALHLARTVARRAERHMVELAQKPDEAVTPAALKYINRVSDFLFVAARVVNDNGARDVLWVPGHNR